MHREVTLDELLEEPIVRLLMSSDGVRAHHVRALAETLRHRIAARTCQAICRSIDVVQNYGAPP
jgi:hypothetical protein